jgi:hypothetical protein
LQLGDGVVDDGGGLFDFETGGEFVGDAQGADSGIWRDEVGEGVDLFVVLLRECAAALGCGSAYAAAFAGEGVD